LIIPSYAGERQRISVGAVSYSILEAKAVLQESHIITLTMDEISHEELMNLAKFLRHLTAGIRPTILHFHRHHHHSRKPAISHAFSARAQERMVGLAGLYLFLSPLNSGSVLAFSARLLGLEFWVSNLVKLVFACVI